MFMRMIYDERLSQAAYLIGCQGAGEAIIIDPQRDIDQYIDLAARHDLRIVAAAETHIHADFVSGTREFAHRTGATAYLSAEGGPDWSYRWSDDSGITCRGLHDGDTFSIGSIAFQAIHTPGHTPEHLCYTVTDTAAR
ncbi:MAG: MBL fold metallo-hydrolase, partial [Planctomycetota bacterium]